MMYAPRASEGGAWVCDVGEHSGTSSLLCSNIGQSNKLRLKLNRGFAADSTPGPGPGKLGLATASAEGE